MKGKLAVLLAGLMAATSLAGCASANGENSGNTSGSESGAVQEQGSSGSSESSAGSGEVSGKITIWTWTDISNEIEAYESSHPGTEIEQVVIDAGDYVTKIQTTLASGGDLPDALWGESLNRGIIFEMDILDELTAEPYHLDVSLLEDYVIPSMTNEDGKIVGLERNVTPSGLAYHRDMALEYFGTDDPDELAAKFSTWEDFIKAGQEVSEKSGGKVTMLTSLGDVYYMMNGQSQDVRISDGTIHESAVLDLFTKICQFRDAGIVSQIEQWTPAWYASFASKNSIFSPMPAFGVHSWILPSEEDGESDWGLMIPPGGGFSWGGTCWGITKNSENKELAWDFVYWDTFEEGAQMRFDTEETPSAKTFLTDENLQDENPYFSNQKTMEVYVKEILPTVHVNSPTPYDYADVCAIEMVLSSFNSDYTLTASDGVQLYLDEMQRQAPELKVD